MYYKYINERMVFSDCKTIQTESGTWISNPTAEQIADAGWLPYDPPQVVPVPSVEPEYQEVIDAVKKMLQSSCESLTDEEALEVAALYPTWVSMMGKDVAVGQRYWYDEKLYRVIQAHTVQESWTPELTPSLFAEVSIEEFPEWKQPLGSEDSYHLGDKVSHIEKHWVSTIDYNVYEPGVYGWEEI